MFSGLFVVVALVVLPFRVQATTNFTSSSILATTTSTTVASSATPTPQVTPSVSLTGNSTDPPTQPTTEEPNNATTPLQPTSTTPISTEDKTCAKLTFTLEEKMTAVHKQSPSGLSYNISYELRMLYNDTNAYSNVTASVTLAQKDGSVSVEAELCLLVVKECKCVIEDLFKNKMTSGKLSEVILIQEDSEKFEPLGVDFGKWKAKDGECMKCEGAGGPIFIERTCTPKGHGCNGHKTSDKSDDCVKYCPTDAGVAAVSCLYVLAIGIFLSLSFQ